MFGQVEPHIGTKTLDGLDVVSGYSFGVCAGGGKDACTAAYEALDFTGASLSAPGGAPSPSILQSHFGGVFGYSGWTARMLRPTSLKAACNLRHMVTAGCCSSIRS